MHVHNEAFQTYISLRLRYYAGSKFVYLKVARRRFLRVFVFLGAALPEKYFQYLVLIFKKNCHVVYSSKCMLETIAPQNEFYRRHEIDQSKIEYRKKCVFSIRMIVLGAYKSRPQQPKKVPTNRSNPNQKQSQTTSPNKHWRSSCQRTRTKFRPTPWLSVDPEDRCSRGNCFAKILIFFVLYIVAC